MNIAVCCITKNEEIHLERLIKNINDLANEIIIVDSFSEDKTKDIALKYNCKFYQKSFDNFSNQKNFCLNKVSNSSEWVLFLDADEYITEELKQEILSIKEDIYDAYEFKRKFFWKGRWVKRGYFPHWFLRLGKKDKIKFDENKINEHLICLTDKVKRLEGCFVDNNLKSTSKWFEKHNLYAEMESIRYFENIEKSKKRLLWNKLPLIIRPFILFFYRLIIKKSIFDGFYVAQYHFYHDFIYRMMIDIKILKKFFFNK